MKSNYRILKQLIKMISNVLLLLILVYGLSILAVLLSFIFNASEESLKFSWRSTLAESFETFKILFVVGLVILSYYLGKKAGLKQHNTYINSDKNHEDNI